MPKAICVFEGCTLQACQRGQFCTNHGPRGVQRCTFPGCNNGATARKLCNSHRDDYVKKARPCGVEGCTSQGKFRGGFCMKHKHIYMQCKIVGCDNEAEEAGGKCVFCMVHEP